MGGYPVKKKTKKILIAIVRILHLVFLLPLAYLLSRLVVNSFGRISDDNPVLAVVTSLGAASIWALFLFRLQRNINHGSDNPYGDALSWTADRSARLVVALFLLFTLGLGVQETVETNSYWWVGAVVALILLGKPRSHFKEWLRGLRFLRDKALVMDTPSPDKENVPSDENPPEGTP